MSDPTGGSKSLLNFETVGSIVAMVIGLSALFVAWDQAQIMRKEQHANVLPIISVQAGFSSDAETHQMLMAVENNGVGPALIKSAELRIGDLSLDSWSAMTDDLLPEALTTDYSTSFSSAIGAISDGGERELMRVNWPRTDEVDQGFLTLKKAVFSGESTTDLIVCYCSVFDRCWITDRSTADDPQRVETCPNEGFDFSAKLLESLNSTN